MSSPLDSRMDMRWSLASLSWVRNERFVVHVCVCGVCPGLWSSPGENCGLSSYVFLDCFGSPGEGSGLSSPKRELFNSFLGLQQ